VRAKPTAVRTGRRRRRWCADDERQGESWIEACAHRDAAGRTRRLGDGRRRGDGDGLQEEDTTTGSFAGRTVTDQLC
jgi:hypothetical protein